MNLKVVEPVRALLTAKRAGTRTDAATILLHLPQVESSPALAAALDTEKSKSVREVLSRALEACYSTTDVPLSELTATVANQAHIDARFARRADPSPVPLQELSLEWSTGAAVSAEALRGILSALAHEEELTGLRSHLDQASSSALWGEITRRMRGTKEGRHGWVVASTALLAPESALTEYGAPIDEMAMTGKHLGAFARVEALRRHGSPVALRWLDHWSRRARSKGLRKRAGYALGEAGRALGLNRDEVAEHVLADFGLDAQGERALTYNGADYVVWLDREMKLTLLRDGALRKALPKPKTEADTELRSALTSVRKQLRIAVGDAIHRLEAAMIEGRTWPRADWDRLIANPVHRRLAEQLIWWDGGSRTAFRLAEDGSFADVDDEAVEVSGPIGLAHPVRNPHLAKWEQVLADYKLLPPFPQLRRPDFSPSAADETIVDRWRDTPLETSRLRGLISGARWDRGAPEEVGTVRSISKSFHTAEVTAVLEFEPGLVMGQATAPEQVVTGLTFAPGGVGGAPLKLGAVDPVLYAEVVGAIEAAFGLSD